MISKLLEWMLYGCILAEAAILVLVIAGELPVIALLLPIAAGVCLIGMYGGGAYANGLARQICRRLKQNL